MNHLELRAEREESGRGENIMNDIRKLIVCGVNFSFKCNPFNKFNFMCQHSAQHPNINIQCVCTNIIIIHFAGQNMRELSDK